MYPSWSPRDESTLIEVPKLIGSPILISLISPTCIAARVVGTKLARTPNIATLSNSLGRVPLAFKLILINIQNKIISESNFLVLLFLESMISSSSSSWTWIKKKEAKKEKKPKLNLLKVYLHAPHLLFRVCNSSHGVDRVVAVTYAHILWMIWIHTLDHLLCVRYLTILIAIYMCVCVCMCNKLN